MAIPIGVHLGCGITAMDKADSLFILNEYVFKGVALPTITKCIENVDVSTLDKNMVIPNISPTNPPNIRGVWFPMGYYIN